MLSKHILNSIEKQTILNSFSTFNFPKLQSSSITVEQSFKQFVKDIVSGKKKTIKKTKSDLKDLFFCFQCEQTKNGKGCHSMGSGICGKPASLAVLQDLTNYWARKASSEILKKPELLNQESIDLILESVYATLTNVNFDPERFIEYISKMKKICGIEQKKKIKVDELIDEAGIEEKVSINDRKEYLINEKKISKEKAEELIFIQELLMYGIKGFVAYYYEAIKNFNSEKKIEESFRNKEVEEFLLKSLSNLIDPKTLMDTNELVSLCLKCGEINFKVMEILDKSHNKHFGIPEITEVNVFPPKNGKCVLFTGHNIADLKEFLEETKNEKDLFVYTHGEMLPSHMYPELKKYKHLAGHWGSAWQNQRKEFDIFPGPVIITTNCVMPPKTTYKNRMFTTHGVGVEGVEIIDLENNKKESVQKILQCAKDSDGFNIKNIQDKEQLAKKLTWTLNKENNFEKKVLIGFRHEVTNSPEVNDLVVSAIKEGYIKHFFLIGGCDGHESSRSYFTDVAKNAPKDSVILTLGCGKYRVNDLDLGVIKTPKGDIPRILDVGQCNDSYSAIAIAVNLAKQFGVASVNDLPLTLVISWFEQKAVAVFLTLLHLGVKNIRLGPSLPAFIPPSVLNLLVEQFNVVPVGTIKNNVDIKSDIEKMMKE